MEMTLGSYPARFISEETDLEAIEEARGKKGVNSLSKSVKDSEDIPDAALFESSLIVEESDLERTDPAELADLDCFEREQW